APQVFMSSPANACMAMRFSGPNSSFSSSSIDSEAYARYIFFLAPSFTGTEATCIWTVSASSPASTEFATTTIIVNFDNNP
ncbi:MAG: hypothetical protein HAW61_06390, partial [Candidatus Portiera sp.]|nr:hypothetical protein [Portiera sp.]